MNEEQKKWHKQFWDNFGVTAYLRFGCFTTLWILLGIGLSNVFHSSGVLLIFTVLLMIYGALSLVWKPIYLIHRKILGNPNLPTEPISFRRIKAPHQTSRQRIPWLYYVPAILMAVLTAIITWVVLYYMFTVIMK